MSAYVLSLQEIDRTQVAVAGGKGAHLGDLARLAGIHVPPGFCVTTDAFRRVVAAAPALGAKLDQLARLKVDDHEAIRTLSAEVRRTVEGLVMPDDMAAEVTRHLAAHGERTAYAVRSSATAEDSPTASFAGQHDSYLNVQGWAAVLQHISRCWASLFTERAVTYRLRNGFDHRKVHMAVVVQQMAVPQASGVLFTADPITSHRKIASIEAIRGLGEALVSGHVNPDVYKLRDGKVVTKPDGKHHPALTEAQAIQLVELGRRIEAHFGRPQDIEWCLEGDTFRFVQSRPITTLFPIPAGSDQENHVYVSVGHAQMMTDAMKPLGISLWQLTALRPMLEAGGRMFVDVTAILASPASRANYLDLVVKSEPLTKDALQTILDRGDFIKPAPPPPPGAAPAPGTPARSAPAPLPTDPAIPAGLIAATQASIADLQRTIHGKSGLALIDFILADLKELKRLLTEPQSVQAIMAGMEAAWWLNERLEAWLGEKNAVDVLTQSVPGNVTSEMGLALLDVADVIRPHPDVVAFLQKIEDEAFLDELPKLAGGREARDAIQAYLAKYGMRCAGEIDITRPRWSERPSTLVPVILGHVMNAEPGAGARRFEQGRQEAAQKEQEVLARLEALPGGTSKADEAKRMIDRVRTFAGFREYPKYGIVSRYFVYKQALMQEAGRLVAAGLLREPEDIFYLTWPELQDALRTRQIDDQLIRQRQEAYRSHQSLRPPRVLTSDGECLSGEYRRGGLPAGALVGLPVSGGVVEGRARVILDMAKAELAEGDILVTAYTDPSWTPLFVSVRGLVTEVGGLMTHGAVIAREYGLPAVVGIEHVTRLIQDGQRIRVHGTDGYVEILP